MTNLFNELVKLLEANSLYMSDDGSLMKNKVVEAGLALNPELIKLLLEHDGLRRNFFVDIEGLTVFDKVKFQKFIMNKRFLPDSYTSFKNKIGLTNEEGDFLADSKEVVLSFPYKDCVLEGGQTKEDAKRNEVFWNEILAPDEITRLLEPKVLTNAIKYNNLGATKVDSIKNNNLIIKGNNLIVLHSLRSNFENKINFIYIDPPYNTGSDGFNYNDKFNHSSWLTFMHNRLSIAKKLLKNDGVICVQCSFHEYAYLKVLMDDIFAKHLCTFNIQVRHPDRILTGDKEFNDIIEYTLIYTNNPAGKMPKRIEEKTDDDYVYKISEHGNPEIVYFGDKKVEIFTPDKYSVEICKSNSLNTKKISVRGSIREKNSSGRLYVKYIEPIAKTYPSETLFKVENMGDDALGHRYFYTPPLGNKNGGYYQGKPLSSSVTEKPYANFYNFEKEYNNVASEGGVSFRNGKKPEEFIAFLISIFTKEGDIVLDYHLGSGTTAAVAHKLKRRYIGIEQMDYIETLAVDRLKRVIGTVSKDGIFEEVSFDEGGISKSVNWHGGGEFVYCELATANQSYVNSILKSDTKDDLVNMWNHIQGTSFLSWKIAPNEINDSINDFSALDIDDMKKFLIESLDKNMLYVPFSEISNSEFQISDSDKKINKDWYSKK